MKIEVDIQSRMNLKIRVVESELYSEIVIQFKLYRILWRGQNRQLEKF